MTSNELVFFTAGHGLYHFQIDRNTFHRSLYYNLLFQPSLAAPENFFVQGRYVIDHLEERKSRDTWLETALRNEFLIPFFRFDHTSFVKTFPTYKGTGLKGFTTGAEAAAERLDEIAVKKPMHWDPHENSVRFRRKFESIFRGPPPKTPEHARIDPYDYDGFLRRSEAWRDFDILAARERANDHDSLPVSLLIQATADRLFGQDAPDVLDVSELLTEMDRRNMPPETIRDTSIFFTLACEYYNRALAEHLLAAANSPKWSGYLAALDLDYQSATPLADDTPKRMEFVRTVISVPALSVLRRSSGNILLAIRRTKSAELYFEALAAWKQSPSPSTHKCEVLVESLHRYSRVIRQEVGRDVTTEDLVPCFLSRAAAAADFLGKVPHPVLITVLVLPAAPLVLKATAFGIFCLKHIVKYRTSPQKVEVTAHVDELGVLLGPDATLLTRTSINEESTEQQNPPDEG